LQLAFAAMTAGEHLASTRCAVGECGAGRLQPGELRARSAALLDRVCVVRGIPYHLPIPAPGGAQPLARNLPPARRQGGQPARPV